MSDQISFAPGLTKEEKYISLIPQLKALVEGEPDRIANISNVIAGIKEAFSFFWAGIYFVGTSRDNLPELVLGPFQGPVACTRIAFGKGVCGTAWKERNVILVPDVNKFPGHIACNSASQSEIVLPIFKNDDVIAVLDIDSDRLNAFDETDSKYLSEICSIISSFI